MTTDLDQLFSRERERALPQSRVSLDDAIARGRRRRVMTRAGEGATAVLAGAVVVGAAGWALSGATGVRAVGSASGGSVGAGGSGGSSVTDAPGPSTTSTTTDGGGTPVPAATDVSGVPVPTAGSATSEPTPLGTITPDISTPVPTATDAKPSYSPRTVNGKQVLWAGEWPAGLELVTLPDVPGFGTGRRFPDALEPGEVNGVKAWTATFGIGPVDGSDPQVTVYVGDFPTPPFRDGTAKGVLVRGVPASYGDVGGQSVLYVRTATWAIQVVGQGTSLDQLVSVAQALRNVD